LKIIAAVVGFGSIGRKHCKVLSSMGSDIEVSVLTSQKDIPYKKLKTLEDLVHLNPDYVIIASPTSHHFHHLDFLDKRLKNKKLLVEKPLFEKNYDFFPKNNKVYVGYNLRFNPLISSLKEKLKDKDIWNINIFCGSNLVDWRQNINYQNSSSAKKKYGGGVLLDLSHEIDYLFWLFGPLEIKYARNTRLSNLDIETDDFLTISGNTKKKTNFQVTLNYFSKIDVRRVIIDGLDFFLEIDLINNEVVQEIKGKKVLSPDLNFKTDDSYSSMHRAIISSDDKNVCSFNEGIEVMKIIEDIREFSQ